MDKIVSDFCSTVCEKMNYGLLLMDLQGCIQYANNALTEMLGLDAEMVLIGKKAAKVENALLQTVLADPNTKAIYRNELNGKRIWVVPARFCPEGGPPSQAFLFEDVTERELLRQGLYDTGMYKGILEQILENAYEGVVVTDAAGIILMFNNAYANYLNIRAQDAIGRHVTQVIDNTRVHKVVKSGMPEFGKLQKIGSHKAVVTRLPITLNDKTVAGVGIVHFRELRDMRELLDKLSSLETELAQIKEEYGKNPLKRYTLQDLIGSSPVMADLKNQIRKAAASASTVLILGENGTGKELVAHSIHHLSSRSGKPFIRLNCAAIPEEILESELFGYVGGAFTGSNRTGKQGKIEAADGGTLFLDEIGDMSFHMQAKLLRFLQEKEVERLGENKIRTVDVRVLAATNQNLRERIKNSQFREDLYYRLQVVQLDVPPLRRRMEDIDLLVDYFIEKFNRIFGKKVRMLQPEVLRILKKYHWPGNIRQLENVMERAFNMVEQDEIALEHVPGYLLEDLSPFGEQGPVRSVSVGRPKTEGFLTEAKDELERREIADALTKARGNKSEAARLLGITRMTLYLKLKKYGL